MNSPDWRAIGRCNESHLGEARLQAHHAVQWLARAARAYVPARPHDSHTSLGLDDDCLATHPLKGDLRLALRLPDLTLVLSGAGNSPQTFVLDRRTDRDAGEWVRTRMTALGLDARALDAPSPYEVPAHAVDQGAADTVAAMTDAFHELAAWFANAHASLTRIRDRLATRALAPSPLRCWPHHFDLATIAPLDTADLEHARSVNTGFSPGDEHYAEPYFYVSPYPYPEAGKLPRLPPIGHWHTQHFTAAIAPMSRIVAAAIPQADTEIFLAEAVDGAIAALR